MFNSNETCEQKALLTLYKKKVEQKKKLNHDKASLK